MQTLAMNESFVRELTMDELNLIAGGAWSWKEFGRSIKAGVQDMFGMNKEKIQDLLIFVSSHDDKYTTLKEYVDRMGDNKEILYVPAESVDAAKYLPKMEKLKNKVGKS